MKTLFTASALTPCPSPAGCKLPNMLPPLDVTCIYLGKHISPLFWVHIMENVLPNPPTMSDMD